MARLDESRWAGGTIVPLMTLRDTTVVVALALCAAVAPRAAAQPGQLSGVVVDATGAVLPGATVALSPSTPTTCSTGTR
ncbi:MAG: hypothetical protein J4F37_09555 [Acidobacteria bacterium]|nr:hypothetical protein [Acidobacteriota bacterium]